ncbi:hypothetical protein BDP27DRAFT_1335608 [Rhodocollybia butyracea]|uniref:Uncharacterized protein n=1 Tax=Rhodocollybia butyracea TaxID=206335 RepID=A0A9P5U114_9AGAR|nr:hypothetical protein BDP27DRAFT_1335608 [Rhodocollybia butyracea]
MPDLAPQGVALNANGSLKDASNIKFYNSAGDESDNPITGQSSSKAPSRKRNRTRSSRMTAAMEEEQKENDSDGNPILPTRPRKRARRRRKAKTPGKADESDGGEYSTDDGSVVDSSDSDKSVDITNEELANSLSSETIPERGGNDKGKAKLRSQSTRNASTKTQKGSVTLGEVEDEEAPRQFSVSTNKKSKTSNPIYLFFELVDRNEAGDPGTPGDKHYKCFHGKRKTLTITKAMKSSLNGLTMHLKNHFPPMYRLWEVLHQQKKIPTAEEVNIACGKTTLDAQSATAFLGKLETVSYNIQAAFDAQARKAAGPWDQAKFESLLLEWIIACKL